MQHSLHLLDGVGPKGFCAVWTTATKTKTIKSTTATKNNNKNITTNINDKSYLRESSSLCPVMDDHLEDARLHEASELALPLLQGDSGANDQGTSPGLLRRATGPHLLLRLGPSLLHHLVLLVDSVGHNRADRLSVFAQKQSRQKGR